MANDLLTDLKAIPLLGAIADDELRALAKVMERREITDAQRVIKSDEPGQFMMFVLAGKLRVVLSNTSGRELVVDVLESGDMFGELALLTGEKRSADVEAMSAGSILVLAKEDFEKHVAAHKGLALALLHELAQRLRRTTMKIGDLALLDVYRRLARALMDLSEECPGAEVKRMIKVRPTHRELAALTGTTREMVTRALKELEEAGHIKIEGKKIWINSLPI